MNTLRPPHFLSALLCSLFASLLLSACASSTDVTGAPASQQAIVVTANPLATEAGAAILKSGGSAVDAALAIEAVLSLVEPQSSGLAGGAFMTYYDAANKKVTIYDGRETAPSGARQDMFLDQEGNSIGFLNAKNSGLSTGVPGVVSMFTLAHKDHGLLPWGSHFDNAIALAENGFSVSPRLHGMIARFGKYIPKTPEEGPTDAAGYFFDENGEPLAVGTVIKSPEYAETLELLKKSPDEFYTGKIADQIIEQVQIEPRAGYLTADDLAAYQAQQKAPLCTSYKTYQLCGPPPASSWIAVAQIMGILEQAQPFSAEGAEDPSNWTLFSEAQRLAYADRDHFVADTAFVEAPLDGLLDKEYLKQRASMIKTDQPVSPIVEGNPWLYQQEQQKVAIGRDATIDNAGTTHFVVIDKDGNVVSMTA
ncbi:MAG: gamma-glutamyltransferase, partial [Pseudomonadota bacterium]